MKLTVLTWFKDSAVPFLGKIIEVLFRIILFILPLGVYLFLVQNRDKASKVSNLSVYTNDNSVWQHVFPGFILVAVDAHSFEKSYLEAKRKFQNWISTNRYILALIFMTTIVILMIINGGLNK